MNCPSRTDEPEGTGKNQQPNALSADLTTRQDLNGIANARQLRKRAGGGIDDTAEDRRGDEQNQDQQKDSGADVRAVVGSHSQHHVSQSMTPLDVDDAQDGPSRGGNGPHSPMKWLLNLREVMMTFGKFIGPGFMVWIGCSF